MRTSNPKGEPKDGVHSTPSFTRNRKKHIVPVIIFFSFVFSVALVAYLLKSTLCDVKNAEAGKENEKVENRVNKIVVRVNGVAYTEKQFNDDVGLRMLFLRERGTKNNVLERKEKQIRKELKDKWINGVLLEEEAKRLGVRVDENIRLKMERKYLRTFGRKGIAFDDLRMRIKESGFLDAFERNFNTELIVSAYLESQFKKESSLTEEDIIAAEKRIKDYNFRASCTNSLIFALASNICVRARSGEDFSILADKYSQEEGKSAGGYVGVCTREELKSDGDIFADKVWALKSGEVSDVLDTIDSYTVVKMIKRIDSNAEAAESAVEIAWIRLMRPQFYEEYSRKELKRRGESQLRNRILAREIKRLRENAKIEFAKD